MVNARQTIATITGVGYWRGKRAAGVARWRVATAQKWQPRGKCRHASHSRQHLYAYVQVWWVMNLCVFVSMSLRQSVSRTDCNFNAIAVGNLKFSDLLWQAAKWRTSIFDFWIFWLLLLFPLGGGEKSQALIKTKMSNNWLPESWLKLFLVSILPPAACSYAPHYINRAATYRRNAIEWKNEKIRLERQETHLIFNLNSFFPSCFVCAFLLDCFDWLFIAISASLKERYLSEYTSNSNKLKCVENNENEVKTN